MDALVTEPDRCSAPWSLNNRPVGAYLRFMQRVVFIALAAALVGCGGGVTGGGSSTGGQRNPVCEAGASEGEVQAPVFVRNLRGQTSWFASPVVVDLDGDGSRELVAAYYDVFVFDAEGVLIAMAEGGDGRVYAPHVVADLEGDGLMEIVYGSGHQVFAYEFDAGVLTVKDGWPRGTTTAGNAPEVRGLAAGDLDGDGSLEIVATTTQTASTSDGGAQVFVFGHDGRDYRPEGVSFDAWPRYNARSGEGGDADRHGMGHRGYGCYGLNVGIGDIDDDADLEILVTYDNHHLQAFDPDGEALDASPWFRNRQPDYRDERLTWGQFIRWADRATEERHYHLHEGEWPHPRTDDWLQWTASPPNVADVDGDGDNEVIGVPNVERNEPYETVAYAVMVLEGNHGDGSRAARRLPGWEALPRGGAPVEVDGWYPPGGIPAPATVDLQGDARPEIVVSLNDRAMHAFDAAGVELWRHDYGRGRIVYASEPTVADLNQDGSPEVLFTTYGSPDRSDAGRLVILGADGSPLHDVPLPDPGHNGNGNGAPAAPTVGDLDGDGALEIFVQTFDHGMDVFEVPGSAENCLPWSTARGGPLRMGQPNGS
jgi:hypothetical protein